MPWEIGPKSVRPGRPREPGLNHVNHAHDQNSGSGGLSGRVGWSPHVPGHRPAASALGSILPARWAGGVCAPREELGSSRSWRSYVARFVFLYADEDAMSKIETHPWDPAEHLESEEAKTAYLEAALEDGDPALVAAVLDDIARAM